MTSSKTFGNRLKGALHNWLAGLIAMLVVFTLLRLVFHLWNSDLLAGGTAGQFIGVYYWGWRYDLAWLYIASLPVLLLYLIGGLFEASRTVSRITGVLAAFYYSTFVIIGVADIPYFRFNGRRATREVFSILSDSASAFPAFLVEYAGFVLLCLLSISFVVWIIRKPRDPGIPLPAVLAIGLAGLLLAVNFGRPLTPKNATIHTGPQYVSLVTNTLMTLSYSIFKGQATLEEKHYFPAESDRREYFRTHHELSSDTAFQERNVVVFVLESFSREYLLDGHPNQAPAPFLDSIMGHSIVFSNAYANGTTSAYGLMSILGGIPPFLDEPYFASIYGDNRMTGIGSLLEAYGYTRHFFYGAEEDHYGFRKNMALLGIDRYHSMEDYREFAGQSAFRTAYDGNWGIYDGPFLQYAVQELSSAGAPFFATIFNISTHFPYMVPPELTAELDKGSLASHQSIAYTDRAIRDFFRTAAAQAWYDNTLFVFIADHWAKMREMEDRSAVGIYRIPCFIYDPSRPAGLVIDNVFQQVDVVPALLDMMDYSGPWMSFGRTPFGDTAYRFTFNEFGNIYRIIDSSYVLAYDEHRELSFSLHDHVSDPELETNLLGRQPDRAAVMERYLKAVIQAYNNQLIHNDVDLRPRGQFDEAPSRHN